MLAQTHFFFALALGYALRLPAKVAAIAGLLVDWDIIFYFTGLGFPFVHRGIFHTPIVFAIALIAIYLLTKDTRITAAAAAGMFSHLFLDTLNPTGIMWLYPMPVYFSLNAVPYSDVLANGALVAFSILAVLALDAPLRKRLDPRRLRPG